MKSSIDVGKLIYRVMPVVAALICMFYSAEVQSANKKLLIIHSYAMDYEWTVGEDKGIVKAFRDTLMNEWGWSIQRSFLNGKKYQEDPSRLQREIKVIKQEIEGDKPDAVILTDDLAFIVFYRFLNALNIPVSFCGVNGYIEDYGYRQGDAGVTGTLEHNNFPAMAKIIKRARPSIDRIVYVGDVSKTTDGIVSTIKRDLKGGKFVNTGIDKHEFYKTSSYDELKNYLLGIDSSQTAVVFISFYTFTDNKDEHVYYRDVDRWINENTNFIDAGIASFHVKNGRMLSLASSADEIGYYCAQKLFEAIKRRIDPSDMGIREYMPLQLILNRSRADKIGVQMPYDILSYARDVNRLMNPK